MLNKLFGKLHSSLSRINNETNSDREQIINNSFFIKRKLLRCLLSSNISVGKNFQLGLAPRQSTWVIIWLFTKQVIPEDKRWITRWFLTNKQIVKWNWIWISLVSVLSTYQKAEWWARVFQLWALWVAYQKWNDPKQLWALIITKGPSEKLNNRLNTWE